MTAPTTPVPEVHTGAAVLKVLRVSLHLGFATLLVVGTVSTVATPQRAASWMVIMISAVLGALYLAGTLAEKRAADGEIPPWRLEPRRYSKIWLASVTLLWLVLLVLSADFSWLAFPLFFLHLHLLHTRHAIVAVLLMTGAVSAAQWNHSGELHAAMIIGPGLGAVFAVVMAMVYESLYSEGVNQRRALDELRNTRAALARTQHESGVLAERERLAREIHDTLAQGLSSIVLISRAAETSLEAGSTALTKERIRTIQVTASENLDEARRFVRGLSSNNANADSLVTRLRRICATAERQAAAHGSSLRCRFELDGEPVQLPPPYEVALLRAAQSTLSNVDQHAQASTAVVTLGFLGPDVTLDVYDNGTGFDAPATLSDPPLRSDGTGFGLQSVRQRVTSMGGVVDIESTVGEGTVVAIRLPLAPFDNEESHA
ncbi:sensor histidine kinase [Arthrobacter sp. CAL618]|uniref:sensor histidine kinase n=1 Tax=Arthrobacter sp. CAL618 TaxID=1055770 RepID=UPI0003FEF758|nr:sensor histidine kinase [Arthrobacter sp. CAL618]